MFVRKITIKSVCGTNPDIVAVKSAGKAGVHVIRVAGRADRVIKRKSPYETDGENVSRGLAGNFIAVDPATGEVFESTRAFLPGLIQEGVEHALDNLAKEAAKHAVNGVGPGIAQDVMVEFGIDVYAVISPRDENKYEYRIKPYKAIETHSAVKELLDMGPAMPALPAPVSASQAKREKATRRA